MKNKTRKKASFLHEVIIHLILIGLIFGMFYVATVMRMSTSSVKQQILEKQTALLIDSAIPGTTLIIEKSNLHGKIKSLSLVNGRVLIGIGSAASAEGYPYFSRYNVFVRSDEDKFYIEVREK